MLTLRLDLNWFCDYSYWGYAHPDAWDTRERVRATYGGAARAVLNTDSLSEASVSFPSTIVLDCSLLPDRFHTFLKIKNKNTKQMSALGVHRPQ